jgi:hypothetical protein
MAQRNLGVAKVSIFHGKNCGKFGRTKIFETAGWFRRLLLASNHIAQFRFHQRSFGSWVQTAGPAILKRLFFCPSAILCK